MPLVGPEPDPPDPSIVNNPTPVSVVYGSAIAFGGTYRIYVRQNWADDWVEDKTLHCTQCTWSVQPSLPTAEFVYRYGPAVERDAQVITTRAKKVLAGWYVLLEFDCADGIRRWCGYIMDSGDNQGGIIGTNQAAGEQRWTAVGIINALSRAEIRQTVFYGDGMPTSKQIGNSAPIFNPVDVKGNIRSTRSPNKYASQGNTYLFYFPGYYPIATGAPANRWSSRDIAEYLLAHLPPKSSSGSSMVTFVWDPLSLQMLPDWDYPTIDCSGRSLLDVLNDLISPANYRGWHADYDLTNNRVVLKVWTYAASVVAVGDKTIPPNQNQLLVTTATDQATATSVQKAETTFANQVLVRGAKRIAVCTLWAERIGVIERAWTAADQTRFSDELTAALTVTDPELRADLMNALYERKDLYDVYRRFKVSDSFEWEVSIARSPTVTEHIPIFVEDDDEEVKYWPSPGSLRLLDSLPLYYGVDYETITTDMDKDKTGAKVKPIIVGKRLTPTFTIPTSDIKWQDWGAQHHKTMMHSVLSPTYELHMDILEEMHFHLNIQGAPQSCLRMDEPATPPLENPYLAGVPYKSLRMTVAIEEDRHLEAKFPTTPPTRDVLALKVLDFGEALKRIDVLEGTVIGVKPDQSLKMSNGGILRNDKELAEKIAKQAAQFYSVPRQIVRLSTRRLSAVVDVGKLIKELNPLEGLEAHKEQVRSVITEISLSMPVGSPTSTDTWRCSVVTSSGEMDPVAFLPRRLFGNKGGTVNVDGSR